MEKLVLYLLCALLSTTAGAQSLLNDTERKTDAVAHKVISHLNNKHADSAYFLAGEAFKKALSFAQWMDISEKQFYGLLPLRNMEFKRSKNGISKYRIESVAALQLLVSLDTAGKFEILLLQPYQEDAKKKEPAATDNKKLTKLDTIVDKLVGGYANITGNVGASAAVYYNGRSYFYNYGETAKENKQLPANTTFYEIGSITKTFTAALLAKAVADKKVTLNDPVTNYLPDSVAANKDLQEISLLQLCNHSSGLPRLPFNINFTVRHYLQPYEWYDDKALFAFLKQFKATRKPGETYEYSNLAVGLMGVILERIYSKSYEQLVKLYITAPLQMNDTKITLSNAETVRMAQGYNEKGEAVPAWNFKSLVACGALRSTSADLLTYGINQLDSMQSLLLKYFALTHTPTFNDKVQKVGLGWHFLIDDTYEVIQHGGGTYGCRTMLCINTTKNMVVVLLTNNATNGDAVGIRLMQAIEKL